MKKKYFILLILISAIVISFRFSDAAPSSPEASKGTAKPSDYGLKEGDLISAIFSDDPDVYIVNEHGYKRLFLNPEIFKFYAHLGGFTNVKLVTSEVRDSFPTTGLFRNCEDKDQRVFGIDIEGEDQGQLHWVNTTGDQAVKDDPDFFKKVFCINKKEFNWYKKADSFNSVNEVPKYDRIPDIVQTSTQERLESKAETKNIGKVIICHYPPENIQAYQTITIGASALKAHLDHGDTIGACLSMTPVSTSSPQATPSTSSGPTVSPSATPTVTTSPSSTASASFSPTPVPTTSPQATPSLTVTPVPTTTTGPSPTTTQTPTPTPTPSPTPTPTLVSGAPLPPISVTASLGSGKITVSWVGASIVTKPIFVVQRSVNGSTFQPLNFATGYTYDDSYQLAVGSTYRYKVFACDNAGYSCYNGTESNTVTYISISSSTPTPTPVPTTSPQATPTTTISPTLIATASPTPTPTPTQAPFVANLYWVKDVRNKSLKYAFSIKMDGEVYTPKTFNVYLKIPNDSAFKKYTTLSIQQYQGVVRYYNEYYCKNWKISCNNYYTDWRNEPPILSLTNVNDGPQHLGQYQYYATEVYSDGTESVPSPTRTATVYPAPTIENPANGSTIAPQSLRVTVKNTSPVYYSYYREVLWQSNGQNIFDKTLYASDSTFYVSELIESGSPFRLAVGLRDSQPVRDETQIAESTFYVSSPISPASTSFNFNRDLYLGMRGDDVKQLQALLVKEVSHPTNLLTGYFGQITKDAVIRLQGKYNIKPASGYFGAITRKAVNVLISNP